MQEEEKAKEEEGVPDEEGWVKVTRRGRRPVLPRTEAASLRVLEKEKRKRARKELLNFYAWQHRETKMERKGLPGAGDGLGGRDGGASLGTGSGLRVPAWQDPPASQGQLHLPRGGGWGYSHPLRHLGWGPTSKPLSAQCWSLSASSPQEAECGGDLSGRCAAERALGGGGGCSSRLPAGALGSPSHCLWLAFGAAAKLPAPLSGLLLTGQLQ